MSKDIQDYIKEGRKTFFIAPDVSLFPDSYLEDFMLRGYETYLIHEDRLCSLEFKIDILVNLFPDLILFIYIDNNVEEVNWKGVIKRLQEKVGDEICIGVLYSHRKSDEERKALERYYLFDCGVQGGCIALEFQKEKNFPRLEQVLAANQACGRRKHIRALCNGTSKVVLIHKDEKFSGHIFDVSDSHFSCSISQDNFDIQMYEKVTDVLLEVNGLYLRSDATLSLMRKSDNEIIYVFVFNKKNGQNGLERDVEVRLVRKIYSIISAKINNLLNTLYLEATRRYRKRDKLASDEIKDLLREFQVKEELAKVEGEDSEKDENNDEAELEVID